MAKKIEILENTLLKLLVRRGSNADREDVILSEGELGYTTDTNRLFVGDGVTPGGKIVGNRFLGTSNSVTTFANANVGDLAYDADDRALYAYAGPDPATSINGWTLISSVTDENTSNIKISVGNLDEGVNNIAGDGVVINNGRLAIDCAGINTNKIAPCTNVNGALELPNTIQYGNNAAYTYSIPARTGSAGKFLVGDNNGNLSWSSDINVGSVTYFSTAEQVIPVGSIVAFADLDAVESNWLICNGAEYDKTDYPDLFDIIGYDYGGDDPLFQVPDLRDKVLYGTEDKPTNVGDIEIGSDSGGGGSVFGTEWSYMGTQRVAGTYFSASNSFITQGTTYTNDTGYYLVINGQGGKNTQDYVRCDVIIGDVDYNIPFFDNNEVNFFSSTNSGGGVACNGTIIIPPGEKYTFFTEGNPTNFDIWELRGPAGGSVSGISNASDIINIYGGGGGTAGVFGTTNSIPAGTYLVDVNWIENAANGIDEDTALTVSQKFNIPTGNYLHFANAGIEGFYAITTSQTAPIQGSGDWVNINTLTGFKGATIANDITAIINGFAIKLDTTTSTGTGTAQATPTVYAIKAVTDPVVSSTLTVKSPLTASVDGVLQGENPFSSLEGDIEIGIGQSTISLDDIKMFNFRSKANISKGYIESNNSVNDIDTAYRGSLPVTFDSDVKFVELKYSSAIANVPSDAEDGVNGTIYIDWENKKIKQSSLKKDGGNSHQSHWYESVGAESNGEIMFNSSEGTTGTPEGTTQLEGIVIDWDSRQITGLPLYIRDSGGSVAYKYDWQYIFRDLTNSGSFGSAGTGGGGFEATTYDLYTNGSEVNNGEATIPPGEHVITANLLYDFLLNNPDYSYKIEIKDEQNNVLTTLFGSDTGDSDGNPNKGESRSSTFTLNNTTAKTLSYTATLTETGQQDTIQLVNLDLVVMTSSGAGGGGGVQQHKTFFAIGSVEDSGATSQAATTSVTPSTLVSSTANAAACWDSYNNTISTDWSSVFTGYNAFNQGNTPSRTELRLHNPIVAEGGTDGSDQSFYDYKVQIDWESNTVIGTALNNGGNSSSGNKMRVLNASLLSGDNEYAFLRIPTTATNGSSTSPVIRINKELRKITAFPYSEITDKERDSNIAVEITEYVVSSGTGSGGGGETTTLLSTPITVVSTTSNTHVTNAPIDITAYSQLNNADKVLLRIYSRSDDDGSAAIYINQPNTGLDNDGVAQYVEDGTYPSAFTYNNQGGAEDHDVNTEIAQITNNEFTYSYRGIGSVHYRIDIIGYISSSTGSGGGGSSLLKYGTIDVGDPGPITGGSIPTTGDFTTIDLGNDGANFYDIFECTFNSSLPNSNYNVVFELISNGSVNADNNMRYPIITEKTAAGFTFSIEEGTTATQDLKINVRIESNEVTGGGGGGASALGIGQSYSLVNIASLVPFKNTSDRSWFITTTTRMSYAAYLELRNSDSEEWILIFPADNGDRGPYVLVLQPGASVRMNDNIEWRVLS